MAAVVLQQFMPESYAISMYSCVLLAAAYGIGALTQVSGTELLVRNRAPLLTWAAVGQLVTLTALGFVLVPALGVLGVALSVLASRIALLIIHIGSLLRHQTVQQDWSENKL
jgi:hypothetical protein